MFTLLMSVDVGVVRCPEELISAVGGCERESGRRFLFVLCISFFEIVEHLQQALGRRSARWPRTRVDVQLVAQLVAQLAAQLAARLAVQLVLQLCSWLCD